MRWGGVCVGDLESPGVWGEMCPTGEGSVVGNGDDVGFGP